MKGFRLLWVKVAYYSGVRGLGQEPMDVQFLQLHFIEASKDGTCGFRIWGTLNRDIGVILGLYRNNGRENRKYYIIVYYGIGCLSGS